MRTCKECGAIQTPEQVGTWCYVKGYDEHWNKIPTYWLCGTHYKEMREKKNERQDTE